MDNFGDLPGRRKQKLTTFGKQLSMTIGKLHGNVSLIIDMGSLSYPGTLSDGKAITNLSNLIARY